MKSCLLILAVIVGACGGDGNPNKTDAGVRADAPPSCPAPSMPLATGAHKVFLAFEGVTITLGDCDDATTNCSSLVSQATTMVPPFLDGQSNRVTHITAISGLVQEALAPFSIDAVTTRPASGDYWMVVVGGDPTLVGGATGDTLAAKPVCDAANKHSIAFVFDGDVDTTDRAYADTIAGAFGQLVGLVSTTRDSDCTCTASTCTHAQTCTWGTGIVAPPGNACMRTNQNEHLLMINAVGCR